MWAELNKGKFLHQWYSKCWCVYHPCIGGTVSADVCTIPASVVEQVLMCAPSLHHQEYSICWCVHIPAEHSRIFIATAVIYLRLLNTCTCMMYMYRWRVAIWQFPSEQDVLSVNNHNMYAINHNLCFLHQSQPLSDPQVLPIIMKDLKPRETITFVLLVTCHQWGHPCSWFFLIFHMNYFSFFRQYLDFIKVSLKFTFFNFWTQGKLSGSLNWKFWCYWVVMSITSVSCIYKHKQWGSLPQQCSKHFYFQSNLPLHIKSYNIKINPTISLNNFKKWQHVIFNRKKDSQWVQNLKWHASHMNKTEI